MLLSESHVDLYQYAGQLFINVSHLKKKTNQNPKTTNPNQSTNQTNQTENTDLLSNSKFEGQKLVACSPQLLKSKAILSACQTDITGKERSALSSSVFASTWSSSLLHPYTCNLEFSSATCCIGFFLSGGLTRKIAFVSLRSAQCPARAVHGEVQVVKARRSCSIPSLHVPCLTTSTKGSPEAAVS